MCVRKTWNQLRVRVWISYLNSWSLGRSDYVKDKNKNFNIYMYSSCEKEHKP
jgi:hypothetical protein